MNECIAIAMTVHNNAATLKAAIDSVLSQKGVKRDVKLIVSLDNSNDESLEIAQFYLPDDRIIIFQNQFSSAAKNRNFILNYCRENLPGCVLTGRLDADDVLEDELVLSKVEKLYEQNEFDVLICSNRQKQNGEILSWINRAEPELLDYDFLLARLKEMSLGNPQAELPSCNTFMSTRVKALYPERKSAEDHWLLVELLLQKETLNICIAGELVYCVYSLDGCETAVHQRNGSYLQSRCDIYEHAKTQIGRIRRQTNALKILKKYKSGDYCYLGSGFSGVVFHDAEKVYKVHLPVASNNYNEIDHILYLKQKLSLFRNRKHFYDLQEILEIDGIYILVYPYEVSEKVSVLTRADMISFLAEMWDMKIICRSITKQNNFIRVNKTIKLIDYEIEPYNDNLFLNVVARAFIQLNEFERPDLNYDKLKRSLINNFTIPELNGLWPFTSEVFRQVSLRPANTAINETFQPNESPVRVTVYDGVARPKTALLIKACIQDSRFIYSCVRHIVTQLPKAVKFSERILLLELYRSFDFLRQYSSDGNAAELIAEAERLRNDRYIDSILIAPNDAETIRHINRKWLGYEALHTHTTDKIPVTSQIYAFDAVDADYILQMDCDVLIGSRNPNHDFLQKPIQLFEEHRHVVTAGFQICHHPETKFQAFTGFEGDIPVDPRNCLIHKKRLLNLLPLTNESTAEGWKRSWYRALQLTQKEMGAASVRGGETSTYYIHPQNYRKVKRKVWQTIQKAVEEGRIPECQQGEPEVRGTLFDWTTPKRSESLVVILHLDSCRPDEWTETLQTIVDQDYEDTGVIVIHNGGEEIQADALKQVLKPVTNCTWIETEQRLPFNEVVYDVVHWYMTNEKSMICLMRQGDKLFGKSVFSDIMNRLKLYDSELLVGKEISEKYLPEAGVSWIDFVHPRSNEASLDNGLQVFRKQLFDSLSHFDLKKKKANEHMPGFKKMKNNYEWIDDSEGHTIMAPMVELSRNPIRFDHFNVLRGKCTINPDERAAIFAELQQKASKKEGDVLTGRKVFQPNLQRIELDITYDCNLKCMDCNRSCSQASEKIGMTLEQVKAFVSESIALGKKWELINVLGGEPTLHPEFDRIVQLLLDEYVNGYSPDTTIQITSNGYGSLVREKLSALPTHANLVVDTWSFKDSAHVPYFTPFNVAPQDTGRFQEQDYSRGCWVTTYCGIGLNHLGYFPCGIAGAMERVMGTQYRKHTLSDATEGMDQLLTHFCRYCGNFTEYHANRGDFMERAEKDAHPGGIMTDSWKTIYKQWKERKTYERKEYERV